MYMEIKNTMQYLKLENCKATRIFILNELIGFFPENNGKEEKLIKV